ncbi:MAG: DUF1294 domain-containing protein [Saprospiraceae bacterium]
MIINTFYLLLIFLTANIWSYKLMYKDKKIAILNKSKTGKGRVPEAKLFWASIFMGFVGIALGMIILNHKTRKNYFRIGVPITAFINIILYSLLVEKLEEDFNCMFIYDAGMIGDAFVGVTAFYQNLISNLIN